LDDFLISENKTKVKELKTILSEIEHFLKNTDSVPVILYGDFNSGSHLDWTKKLKKPITVMFLRGLQV
jgi:endonuclease/exonuclease/phosphatase family metal-dependent hydrolase